MKTPYDIPVGIFNAGIDEVEKIMDEDPGVKAGVLISSHSIAQRDALEIFDSRLRFSV